MTTHPLRRLAAVALLAGALPAAAQQATRATPARVARLSRPLPAWTRGATCYEVFVRSFQDSDGDGIGDLNGLTSRLDYINDGDPRSTRGLGARCIWLMPIAQSPSYHGYDVSDYYTVEKDYGTNADFKRLMTEAHRRGIRVLVDMVLNHSSSEHPYFQAAVRDTTSPYRAWYRFASPKPDQKGPWGQEVWKKSPVRDEYYYAVFSPGMPDLNYATPAVHEEAKKIARFWVDSMGADGFRLDAVSFLVEEGKTLEHSPGTHAVLHEYGDYVRSLGPSTLTVAEVYAPIVNQLPYYPDQIDTYFGFEQADSIISRIRAGSARGILAPVLRMQAAGYADRWSPFLGNHDRPRTRTDIGRKGGATPEASMARQKLAALVTLTLPGIPYVYYGEELGMTGDKPDERLRTPMQWTSGAGGGFTTGTPWERMADDSSGITVAAQDGDPRSLLNLTRTLIHLRDDNPGLGRGRLTPLTTSDSAVVAYVRRRNVDRQHDWAVIVVANLSDAPRSGVTLAAAARTLPPGRWVVRSLLDGTTASRITVGTDGRVSGYVPLPTLAPLQGYVFELTTPGVDIR